MNQQQTFVTAAITGALAVALGAFGAHALKPMLLAAGRTDTFELAVRYQFYHTAALFIAGLLQVRYPSKLLRAAPVAFIAGILLFSGSLFALCFTGTLTFALITPAGGVLLLTGWLLLLFGIIRAKQ